MRGKSLDDVSDTWDLLGGEGIQFFAFQEVGGLKDLPLQGWDQKETRLGKSSFMTFYCSPPDSFRGTVVGIPLGDLQHVIKVVPLQTGLAVVIQRGGCKEFIISLHLPHRQRKDCLRVWHEQLEQLRNLLHGVRFSDDVFLLSDLNIDLQ